MKDMDAQCEKCINYLKENRGCTIQELSEATEVPVNQIIRFIHEGRISIANSPNISYGCEVCGAPIRSHTMCEACRQKLSKKIAEERLNQKKSSVSFQIKDRLDNRFRS
jgi:flagellar biosynthesis component FlhA